MAGGGTFEFEKAQIRSDAPLPTNKFLTSNITLIRMWRLLKAFGLLRPETADIEFAVPRSPSAKQKDRNGER